MNIIKKYPYIVATFIGTLLGIVVYLCEPKEYTAITTLSDESKEMDLSIGFKELTKHIRNISGGDNAGINNMALYCKLLKTEDFARSISRKQLSTDQRTYGDYLACEDTIKTILDHINYNYSEKNEIATITFTDKDPNIAAQILDSITVQLQSVINHHRQLTADSALQNAKRYLSEERRIYKQAQVEHASFLDSNRKTELQQIKQEKEELRLKLVIAKDNYQDAVQEYARQQALKQRSYLSFAIIKDNTVPTQLNKHLIGYVLAFVFLALLFTRGAILYKEGRWRDIKLRHFGNLFSPWLLTMAIWGVILGLYYTLETDLYPITEQFYYSLILWLPIFCTCAVLTYMLTFDNRQAANHANEIDFNKSAFNFVFIVSLVITPLYVYRIYQMVTIFGTENLMNNIRVLAVHGGGQGFLSYSSVINQAMFIVALWAYPRIPTWQVVLLGIACLTNALAIMEKGTMLLIFACTTFVLYERRIIKIQSILFLGFFVIVAFYFFNLARAQEGSDYQENETLIDFFIQYALSPPVAFCQLLPETTPQFGTNTFETIYLFLRRFGADVIVKAKLQEFVMVPMPTNVYTIFQPFFIDFGYRGIAFFAVVYGVVSGYLYRLFRNGNNTGTCIYTYGVYVLLMQFYQENVFMSMVFIIQFIVFTLLFTQNKIRFAW